MSFNTVDQLCHVLSQLRLVDQADIDECMMALGPGASPSDALAYFESKHLLTSYQVMQLQKGGKEGLVLGRYKLLYRNASGSFARVYRVCSLDDGSMLGMKVLRQRWAEDPQMVSLFRREAQLGRKLKHRNIVPIHEIGNEGDYHFFTMDFIVGGNLRDFLNIRKKLSPVEATRYVLDIAMGLEYALGQGVTHRDLKLTNVLMDTNGTALLIDFGLAGGEHISESGSGEEVQRALEYSTLERATKAPDNDPRSDLFFLGAIYFELLTGQPPYPRTRSREERKHVARYQNLPSVRDFEPDCPDCVVDICSRLQQFLPEMRLQTPGETAHRLRLALREMGETSPGGDQAASLSAAGDCDRGVGQRAMPTVMCIENRLKQQDILRQYLSKRGFRVLMLSDLHRAMDRLRTNPPDCMVLMGGAIGDEIANAFFQAERLGRPTSLVVVAVLAERQARIKNEMQQSPAARVLVEPIQLRDLRREIHLSFQRIRGQAKDTAEI